LTDNGTSVHWHGLRQLGTNVQDGTNGITECPIAPGDSKTYTFQATQFGTSWYHSHHSAQYGDGAFGGIIINGPASSNYDEDLGTYTINDWFHESFWQASAIAAANLQRLQNPPTPDNILLNGTNKNAAGAGSYGKVTLTKGKKYRLRLINTSVDNAIRVSLDNHPFTVISADFVPIHAYTTNWILINIGQRYDVIITANQTASNYWFRAVAAADCYNSNGNVGLSIFNYAGVAVSNPTTTAAAAPSVCQDEQGLVPYVQNTVPRDLFAAQVGDLEVDVGIAQVTTNGQNIVFWGINMSAMDVSWDKPTLQYVLDHNTSYPSVENLIEIPNQGTWSFWIIQETHGTLAPFPHPIHLHGHDFYVLGSGSGVYDKVNSINSLTFNNPIRRDVANLPGGGWLAIAFQTDNPGAWLMHCHITWHLSGGFGVQFLESKNQIPPPPPDWKNTCNKWSSYAQHPAWPKEDSGL
jgi:FtsP/CotA-like multicopper oxidase with cupredoxin domain